MSSAEHLRLAKDALALGYLKKLKFGGDVSTATRHLDAIAPDAAEFEKATSLRGEIAKREKAAERHRKKQLVKEAKAYAAELARLERQFVKVMVIMAGEKADGRDWDGPGAGAPDPFVVVAGVSYRSARCQDTYRCAFRVLAGDGDFRVDVYDADAMGDDWAGATLCGRGAVCDTEAARVIVEM